MFLVDQGVHENGQKAEGQLQTATYNDSVERTWPGKMHLHKTVRSVWWWEETCHSGCWSKLIISIKKLQKKKLRRKKVQFDFKFSKNFKVPKDGRLDIKFF